MAWLLWLAFTLCLLVATLVTTMSDKTKEAFYSVTLLVLVGFAAPSLYLAGFLAMPFVTDSTSALPATSLVDVVFAAPQIFAVVLLVSLYTTLHLLGYTKGVSTSFFIFVKPFYASQYVEIKVDESHIRMGTRGNSFKTPIALALADVVMDHGYNPLYVYGGQDGCKVVTNEATMILQTSKRAALFMDAFNKYRPVKPFNSTMKVQEVRLDPAATRLGFLGFGLLRRLL